jgi:hypothetical protein
VSDTRRAREIVENVLRWRDRFRAFFVQELVPRLAARAARGLWRLTIESISD